MAVKKLLISLGQSNSDPIGDEASWLQLHPNADLYSISRTQMGSKSDIFNMPGSFPGYSTLNLRGLAMSTVKYLTFYNASASGYPTYPGTGVISTVVNSSSFEIFPLPAANGSISNQAGGIPRAVTIKRALTGTYHRVTANTTAGVVVDPPFSPDPFITTGSLSGEQFFYNLVLTATPSSPYTQLEFGWSFVDTQYASIQGNLLNLKIRCTRSHNANNHGAIRTIVGMVNSRTVIIDSAFPHNPQLGDTFEFEFASDHLANTTSTNSFGGTTLTDYVGSTYATTAPTGRFDKWAYFLPWCPFEGLSNSVSGKKNPFPPGFNYQNDYSAPYRFNLLSTTNPGRIGHFSAYHTGLAMRFRQLFGEEIYICNLGIGSTSLAQNEKGLYFTPFSVSPTWGGWIDPVSHSNWSPGALNSLYQRFLDILDTAVAAAAAEGHTLEVIGVFMSQGESDSAYAVWANAYEDNLRSFKALVRKAIKDRNLYSGLVETIPWVQGKITTEPWGELAPTIREAVQKLAYEDPYMETFETDSFLKISGDPAHFSGAGITQWETAAFNAWERATKTGTTEVDICNLALSHLGEGTKITSINPQDGSVQSSYCATFYPIARNSLLEMQPWNFAMRRATLVATTSESTEWEYAYELPENAAKIVAVLGPDSQDDYSTTFAAGSSVYYTAPVVAAGTYNPQPYAIEVTSDGKQVIYTDQADAIVRYVDRVIDPRAFSQTFIIALSWHLASMLAGPVIKGDQGSAEAKRCQQMLMLYLGKAESHDATQRNIKPEQITPWISGR